MSVPVFPTSLLSLELVQQAGPLDHNLLTAARQHVGAAGLAQTTALERLIAAGQEHAGLIMAFRKVAQLLEDVEADAPERALYQSGVEQLELLKHLESLIAAALRQITATPMEAVSAAVLESLAAGTRRHVTALEGLLRELQAHAAGGDHVGRVTEIRAAVQAQFTDIARLEALGQLRAFELLGRELISRVVHVPLVSQEEQCLVLETLGRAAAEQMQVLQYQERIDGGPPL